MKVSKDLIEDCKFWAEELLPEDLLSAMEEKDFERLAIRFIDKHPGSEVSDEAVWEDVMDEYEKEHDLYVKD